jgi:IPT/TIG domain
MTGSGPRDRRIRLSLLFLLVGVPAIVLLAASAAAVAHGSGTTAQAAPQAPPGAVIRHGKTLKPREVHPSNGLHKGQTAKEEQDAEEAEAQPVFPPGKVKTGPPTVISDRGPSHKRALGPQSPLTATGNFALLNSFTAATAQNTCAPPGGGSCSFALPPDTQMAAGQNTVVEDINNNMFVYRKDGTLIKSFPLTDIFQPPGQNVNVTDPKIVFDPTSGNYYFTEMVCQNGTGCGAADWTHMGISLAVSSNPADNWFVYDYLNDGNVIQDQEKLGFSGDKITFAVNAYGDKAGNTGGPENVVVMQKSDVVAHDTVDYVVYSDNSSSPTFAFDSMPTTPVNASTSDNTQYVVWSGEQASSNYMKLVRITGTPDANNVDFTGNVNQLAIANQTTPPVPLAQGGNLCTGGTPPKIPCAGASSGAKGNFESAMVQGNDLWAVATDGCTPQYPTQDNTTRDCTRLVEVDLGNNSVSTDVDIGTNGTYRTYPSVNKDSAGHVFFGFTISSSSTYATAALDASSLPLPGVLQRIDFAAGDSSYTGSRWGDYSGTQQDPANTNDVWSAQEFGACNTGCSNFGSNGWGTAIGQFTFREPQITSISPTQGPVTGGTTVDVYGSEFANGGTTVKFGANTSSSVTWLDSTHIQAVSPAGSVGTVDVTAATAAGTSNTSSADRFTYVKVPTTTTYTGATSGDYHDSVTLSARLTNNLTSQGVAGKTISFGVGAESCTGTTNSSGDASCTVTLADVPGGSYTVQASFAEDAAYLGSSASSPFTVTKEETTISYTSGTVFLAGASSATLTATLVEDGSNDNDNDGGSTPLAGKSVTLSIGTQSCPATTDGSGNASCQVSSVTVSLGSQTVGASFAGDTYYKPDTDSKTAIVFAFPSTGVFTLGDLTVAGSGSSTVTWWSNNWYLLNSLSGGPAPSPFKGFVGTVTLPNKSPANVCSGNWSTSGGNSPPPPATVPSYMGVIVASRITKKGNTISGSYAKIVVVKTDPGYAPGPQNSGTGKIVATFCGQ